MIMSEMTYFVPSIKRPLNRRDDEDNHNGPKIENNDNEFMPVTKKMNHLSIEGTNSNDTMISGTSLSSNSSTTSSLPNEDDSNDSGYQYRGPMKNDHNIVTMSMINNSNNNSYGNQLLNIEELYRTYNPSLKLQQNPIYYDANRILFEAHQMRLLRNMRSS